MAALAPTWAAAARPRGPIAEGSLPASAGRLLPSRKRSHTMRTASPTPSPSATLHNPPPSGTTESPNRAPAPRHKRDPVAVAIRHCDTSAPLNTADMHQATAKGAKHIAYRRTLPRETGDAANDTSGAPTIQTRIATAATRRAARSR
jgi:hypothetical protein